jgi:CubicO group peptidase (beta-lactamase class C family)
VSSIAVFAATLATLSWHPASPPVLDEDQLPLELPELPVPASSIEDLRRQIGEVLIREGVPGAAIALVDRDGPIWIGGVGVADLDKGTPIDGNTVFRVASITKSVVGIAVIKLVEQGKLDLNKPLRELLPDAFDNKYEKRFPVTLAQVLEHTAALDDMRPNEVFVDDDVMTTETALAINPRSRVMRWRPGTRMAYSNVGYSLAARAIEKVTGEPFDVWIRREVLVPMGITEADFRRTESLSARLATGHVARDTPARFRPIAHRGAGALLASATDMAKLVQFWLRRGDGYGIVSRAGLDRIERCDTLPYGHRDIDYGLGNGGDVAHPVKGRGHDGGLPGFLSAVRYFPEIDRGYVILLDATHSLRAYLEIRQIVFSYLARDRAFLRIAAGNATPPEAPFYRYANPRHQMLAFLDTTLLAWGATEGPAGVRLYPTFSKPYDLVPTDDGGYRFAIESGSSTRFSRAPDGTPIMLHGPAYAEPASEWQARLLYRALGVGMLLLWLSQIYAIGALAVSAFNRRRVSAFGLLMWPGIAGFSVFTMPNWVAAAATDQVLGEVNALTVGVFVLSLVYAFAAIAGLYCAFRAWFAQRTGLLERLIPTACAIAAFGIGIWLEEGGVIGLRTWAW